MKVQRIETKEGNELSVDFGVKDRLGRTIGARAVLATIEFRELPEDTAGPYWNGTPGFHYAFIPVATRGGRAYGAAQGYKLFPTAAAREAGIAKYFKDAGKRALEREGK